MTTKKQKEVIYLATYEKGFFSKINTPPPLMHRQSWRKSSLLTISVVDHSACQILPCFWLLLQPDLKAISSIKIGL